MQSPITQDRIINAITTLSEMLGDQTSRLHDTEESRDAAIDLSAEITRELQETRRQLDIATVTIRHLEEDARFMQSRPKHYDPVLHERIGRAELFMEFLQNPDNMRMALGYLKGTTDEQRSNKIGLIKEVRTIAHLGLKQAKDMVEAFLALPAPLPTIGEVIKEKLGDKAPEAPPSGPLTGFDREALSPSDAR